MSVESLGSINVEQNIGHAIGGIGLRNFWNMPLPLESFYLSLDLPVRTVLFLWKYLVPFCSQEFVWPGQRELKLERGDGGGRLVDLDLRPQRGWGRGGLRASFSYPAPSPRPQQHTAGPETFGGFGGRGLFSCRCNCRRINTPLIQEKSCPGRATTRETRLYHK